MELLEIMDTNNVIKIDFIEKVQRNFILKIQQKTPIINVQSDWNGVINLNKKDKPNH